MYKVGFDNGTGDNIAFFEFEKKCVNERYKEYECFIISHVSRKKMKRRNTRKVKRFNVQGTVGCAYLI